MHKCTMCVQFSSCVCTYHNRNNKHSVTFVSSTSHFERHLPGDHLDPLRQVLRRAPPRCALTIHGDGVSDKMIRWLKESGTDGATQLLKLGDFVV